MRRLTRTVLWGASFITLVACPGVRVTPVASGPARVPVPADSVRLFYSREAVPFRYEEVAMLSTEADWLTEDREKLYLALRKKAGEIGANGIIVAPIDEPGTAEKMTSVLIGGSAQLRGDAIAIFLHLADTVATPR
jgi:hypothetical protein